MSKCPTHQRVWQKQEILQILTLFLVLHPKPLMRGIKKRNIFMLCIHNDSTITLNRNKKRDKCNSYLFQCVQYNLSGFGEALWQWSFLSTYVTFKFNPDCVGETKGHGSLEREIPKKKRDNRGVNGEGILLHVLHYSITLRYISL